MNSLRISVFIAACYLCFTTNILFADNDFWVDYQLAGKPSIRGISVLNHKVVWVSGSSGTVARTIDAGDNWQKLAVANTESLDFRDVEVLSESTVLIMSAGPGDQSRIFRSIDSGATWLTVNSNEYKEGFYDGFAFWDSQQGILAGDPVDGKLFLMLTMDAGQSWQRIDPDLLPAMQAGEAGGFAASGSHVCVRGDSVWIGTGGSVARVFYSRNRGKSWQVVNTPMVQGESSRGIFSIDFFDAQHGVAVGGDYSKESEGAANVIITQDGGASWQLAQDFPVYQSSVRYLSKEVLLSTGPEASYISRNAGKNWVKLQGDGYHALSVGKKAVGKTSAVWAAGRDGRIAQRQKMGQKPRP